MVDEAQKKDEMIKETQPVNNEKITIITSTEEAVKEEVRTEEKADEKSKDEVTAESKPEIIDISESRKQGEGGDIQELRQQIEELESEVKELKEKNLRTYAELDNFKKRTIKEKEELIKYSNEELINNLLSVIDNLEMALHHTSEENTDSALHKGVELTMKEFLNILKKYGLESISAVGQPFDPLIHHAMTQVESEEAEENTVISEFRKGYTLNNRVLRASLVSVSKKPEKEKQENHDNRHSEEE